MTQLNNLLNSPPFGRLQVIARAENNRHGQVQWLCQCTCGEFTIVLARLLRNGTTQSCGCLHRETVSQTSSTHRMSQSAEFRIFAGMITRCTNPRRDEWEYYGGRGIRMLFTSFEEFYAEVGPRPSSKHTIDRIDTNGHYAPGNVRWATYLEQAHNRRKSLHRV